MLNSKDSAHCFSFADVKFCRHAVLTFLLQEMFVDLHLPEDGTLDSATQKLSCWNEFEYQWQLAKIFHLQKQKEGELQQYIFHAYFSPCSGTSLTHVWYHPSRSLWWLSVIGHRWNVWLQFLSPRNLLQSCAPQLSARAKAHFVFLQTFYKLLHFARWMKKKKRRAMPIPSMVANFVVPQ